MTDRQLSLVAFTRSKKSYAIYGAAQDLYDRGLDTKIAEDRLQTNALTEGLIGKTTQQVIRERAQKKTRDTIRQKSTAKPTEEQRSLAQRAAVAWQQIRDRLRKRERSRGHEMSR